MTIIQAVLLGLLQGLTEFLPVSSSGHLAIFQNLFSIGKGVEDLFLFDILLHLGTLISIFVVFYREIGKLISEFFGIVVDFFRNIPAWLHREKGRKILRSPYRRFAMMIIISTIPTGILGILLKNIVKAASATLIMPGICLLINAGLLFFAERMPEGYKTPRDASFLDAVLVGIAQGFATLPGISRSGSTITTGLMCGFDSKFVIRYSFIMSIPAVLGAVVLEIKDAIGTHFEISYLVGTLVAAVVGYIAIRVMLMIVRKRRYLFFSIYCLVIGLVAIAGHFIKK
ncbi:MAG: undecaprenyl-diphosphate phosphatase [Lachnospiraceae bacterium]|nr:undecaprenyl-diphosphate phosphatase [Lachnospiraceae bacterium]